jgi:hypothetical protein
MALVACRECNKEISDASKVCIGCGAPVESEKKISLIKYALIVLFGIGVYSCVAKTENSSTQISAPVNTNSPIPLDQSASIDEPFSKDQFGLLAAIVDSIHSRGNSCNTVSRATVSSFDGRWTITCDNHRYEYEFKDVGGKLEYKVIR